MTNQMLTAAQLDSILQTVIREKYDYVFSLPQPKKAFRDSIQPKPNGMTGAVVELGGSSTIKASTPSCAPKIGTR